MSELRNPSFVIAFVIVIVLFLIFGGGMMTGWNGGGMMGSWSGGGSMGGSNWMWIPTLLTLGLGLLLGWLIFGKKR